jgi:Tol biopolymer transport system component/predicted Ser/Thr protein kinase
VSPPQTIAHYRMIAKIGEGGMGEVYRALDTKLGREVAIKIIPETFARDADRMMRFAREARVLASLNHPHIAAIYGVEERALVMELVEGPTLAERITQGPIPLEEALPIARQIADALEYAHEKGVVHRDLKPANIKLTADGQTKVLDFGLAKALSNDPVSGDNPADSPTLTMRATQAGIIMGTAAYMSPEQARGAVADRRADIWSFGVLLYEILTGSHMFGGETVSDTLAAVLRADLDWAALPASTPAPVRRLLRRCLERDRKKRLRDIGDAIVEIDEALAGVPEPAAAPPTARGVLRWWTAALALLTLACLAVAVVHFRETSPQPVPMRFQIPALDKTTFGGSGMALSPDGRLMAFIATGSDGRSAVWVRPLDSLAAQALPGTEGAAFSPFWSPDSRSLGFGVQGKLKKIEASGGPPQTLCEIPGDILGGSWSNDGLIIFGSPVGGLFRVPQAGGVATEFTILDATLGEIGHLRPWFLPDGRRFLYITRTAKVQDQAIYLATLDSKERKRLVGARQAAAYAPPAAGSENGHLLFLREGTLMAQRLDAKRFDLAGEPFPVAEQVGSTLALGYFSVSANGVLAYRSGSSGGNSQLMWFDREGKPLGALGKIADYLGGVALAPDGKRVAVDELDQMGKSDIWMLDLARGVHTRFTFDGQSMRGTWSPDGTRLAFASLRNNIYQKDSSGAGNEELLAKSGSPEGWSRDGRYLLYSVFDAKTNSDLWVLGDPSGPPESRKPVPYLQTPFNERQGQFSPDGHWIAYVSDESGLNQYQIYVQSFPAGAGKFQVSTGAGGMQPRWRRDGKEIFYLAADGKLMAVGVQTAPTFEAVAPKALFDPQIARGRAPPWVFFRYDVTADGKRFLVNSVSTAPESSAPAPITVVVNWLAALKR